MNRTEQNIGMENRMGLQKDIRSDEQSQSSKGGFSKHGDSNLNQFDDENRMSQKGARGDKKSDFSKDEAHGGSIHQNRDEKFGQRGDRDQKQPLHSDLNKGDQARIGQSEEERLRGARDLPQSKVDQAQPSGQRSERSNEIDRNLFQQQDERLQGLQQQQQPGQMSQQSDRRSEFDNNDAPSGRINPKDDQQMAQKGIRTTSDQPKSMNAGFSQGADCNFDNASGKKTCSDDMNDPNNAPSKCHNAEETTRAKIDGGESRWQPGQSSLQKGQASTDRGQRTTELNQGGAARGYPNEGIKDFPQNQRAEDKAKDFVRKEPQPDHDMPSEIDRLATRQDRNQM